MGKNKWNYVIVKTKKFKAQYERGGRHWKAIFENLSKGYVYKLDCDIEGKLLYYIDAITDELPAVFDCWKDRDTRTKYLLFVRSHL